MREQIENAINIIKELDVQGCITGSCLLDYYEGQDVDIFVYSETDLNQLLFFMLYTPMFQILDPLEKHKFEEYTKKGKSSLQKLGLITIKFKYNLCVDINIVYKKNKNSIFDVLTSFDLDIISQGYDIKTGRTLSLRETTGMNGTWNRWNKSFYSPDMWDTKRILRQFDRIIKYTNRGYNLSSVTDKYIEIVEEMLQIENFYKTERGTEFFERVNKEFTLVLDVLKVYKKEGIISQEGLTTLKTLI